jgi:hypothetical protein
MSKPRKQPQVKAREERQRQEQLLERIASAAERCAELERQLRKHPAPELETLIKLHRVLIFKFSLEAEVAPELLGLVRDLMKPVMEWAQLEEKRKQRKFAERRHRERTRAEKAAREGQNAGGGLRPETLERIQRELKLF